MLAYILNNESKNADSMKPVMEPFASKKDIANFKADLMFKIQDCKIQTVKFMLILFIGQIGVMLTLALLFAKK